MLRAVESVAEPPLGSQVAMPHSYFVPLPPDWTSTPEEPALELVQLDLDNTGPFSLALPAGPLPTSLTSLPAPTPIAAPALAPPQLKPTTPSPILEEPNSATTSDRVFSLEPAAVPSDSQLQSFDPQAWQPPATVADFFGDSGDFLAGLQSVSGEPAPAAHSSEPIPSMPPPPAPMPAGEVATIPYPPSPPPKGPPTPELPQPPAPTTVLQPPTPPGSSGPAPALADSLFGESPGDFLSSLTPAVSLTPPKTGAGPASGSRSTPTHFPASPGPSLNPNPVHTVAPTVSAAPPAPADMFAQSSDDFLSFLQAPAAPLQPTAGAKAELVEYLFGPNSASELPDASSLF